VFTLSHYWFYYTFFPRKVKCAIERRIDLSFLLFPVYGIMGTRHHAEDPQMTNPYEDLFKGAGAPDRNDPLLRPIVPESADPLDDLETHRRLNWILLAIYIVGMVLVNVVMYAIFIVKYGEGDQILVNITDYAVSFDVAESDLYEDYPYAVRITGTFRNGNAFALGSVYADFTFLDAEGSEIGTSSYSEDDVAAHDALLVDDTLYFDVPVDSIEYEWGFDMSSGFYLAVNAIHALVLAALFLLVDRRHFADRWRLFKRDWRLGISQIVTGAVLVYAAMIASSLVMDWLGVSGSSENEATIASMFQPEPLRLAVLFLTLCVLTPIVEETIFRRVLFGFFPKRFGPVVPILVSGFVFGLMHVASYGDFIQAIPYVAMGLVFGAVYWMSKRNIYVTMGVHFINNFISFAIYVAALYGVAV